MIELPPKIDKEALVDALLKGVDTKIMPIVEKANEDYEYWDKVKYKKLPEGYTPEMLWTVVKATRMKGMITVWEKYGINLCVTSQMQRLCHEFDMKFGSFWEIEGDTQLTEKKILSVEFADGRSHLFEQDGGRLNDEDCRKRDAEEEEVAAEQVAADDCQQLQNHTVYC